MARVAVITDSSADLPPALVRGESIIVTPVATGILVESVASVAGAAIPEPVARPEIVAAFSDAFSLALRDHEAVVAVLLSSRLGGVMAAARQARDALGSPAVIELVDSRSASMGLGFQALRAAALARQGHDAPAIAADLRAATDRYHVVFSIESVEHLRQSGQIGRAAAMIAEALQLKPLLRIDEGQIVPYERARTRTRAIAELAAFVRDLPAVEQCAVLYATSERDGQLLADIIAADTGLPRHRLTVARIGETVAAQVGPGALGVAVVEPEMR